MVKTKGYSTYNKLPVSISNPEIEAIRKKILYWRLLVFVGSFQGLLDHPCYTAEIHLSCAHHR